MSLIGSRGPTLTQTKTTTSNFNFQLQLQPQLQLRLFFLNPAAYCCHNVFRALESPSLSSALRLSQ